MSSTKETIGIIIISLIFIGILAYSFRVSLIEFSSYPKRDLVTQENAASTDAEFRTTTHFFGDPPGNGIGVTTEWSYDGSKYVKAVEVGSEKKPNAEFRSPLYEAVVVDDTGKQGSIGGKYNGVGDFAFTKDGEHLAFLARWDDDEGKGIDGTIALVLDGVEGPRQKQLHNTVSVPANYLNQVAVREILKQKQCPNIKHIIGNSEDLDMVEIGGKRSVGYFMSTIKYPLVFSDDCKNVAFIVEREGGLMVVMGNEKGEFSLGSMVVARAGFSMPKFSEDNKVIAYGGWGKTGKKEGLWWIVEQIP